MPDVPHGGSASIGEPDYWWYQARADLLRAVLEPLVDPQARILDVGSADGPSVGWLRRHGRHVALDIDPRGLQPGDVCGSALDLPFKPATFDAVAAFDVIEHCEPEDRAIAEMERVLVPGGLLLASVPAYQWAWSEFDDENGHHRRYTKKRLIHAVQRAGLVVERATYAFASVFPAFAAERLGRQALARLRRAESVTPADVVSLPQVSRPVEKVLRGLTDLDRRLLARHDLWFGSSVVIAGRKPGP